MIPRSRLTFTDAQKRWLRIIASHDQSFAASRDAAVDFITATVIRCRLCGAEHRCTIFKAPGECVNCGRPLREEGAA
jgi:hypothetical protein